MSDLFSDITSSVIGKSLDGVTARHRVIANNIANVETPGFTRSSVKFEDELKAAMSSGDPESSARNIGDTAPTIQLDKSSPARPNGNNVSIDTEMTDLARNGVEYDSLIRMLNMRYSMLQTAITEGKR